MSMMVCPIRAGMQVRRPPWDSPDLTACTVGPAQRDFYILGGCTDHVSGIAQAILFSTISYFMLQFDLTPGEQNLDP